MPNLLTPGVYIQEVALGPSPIQGVATSVAGFVGEAERGPVNGSPTLVTSFTEFAATFGSFVAGRGPGTANPVWLPYAVQGFFNNGGQQAYIARALPAATATANFPAFLALGGNGAFASIVAPSSPGAVAGTTNLILSSVVGVAIGAGLSLFAFATAGSTALNVNSVNPLTGVVNVTNPAVLPPGATYLAVGPTTNYVQTTPTAANTGAITLRALYPGFYGTALATYVDAYYANSSVVSVGGALGANQASLASVTFLNIGDYVQLDTSPTAAPPGDREILVIQAINPANNIVTFTTNLVNGTAVYTKLSLINWRIATYYQGALVETLTNLSAALDVNSHASLLETSVNAQSSWITITPATTTINPGVGAAPVGVYPTLPLGMTEVFGGPGADTPAGPNDIIGSDVLPYSGLKSIEAQDGVDIIAAPGWASGTGAASVNDAVVVELIGQAERRLDRFAVFETLDPANVTQLLTELGKYNTQYAAMYAPWLTVLDPVSGNEVNVPPSGHVIGQYANTDNLRGVFKAPANVVLQGILGFSRNIPTGEQDLLNPSDVNVLRNFPGLGNVIWGARTLAADQLWKYIPVRRLFIFLEQSIIQGTRYAVFEPNTMALWARLKDSVTNFLTTQWRAGALFGATASQAFFVKADSTTTTQDDLDNGIVNILVGVAPVKPAEFIVFQIGQASNAFIISESGGS